MTCDCVPGCTVGASARVYTLPRESVTLCTCVVASFAMAGSRVSLTGGIYAYVEVAFGPLVGFVMRETKGRADGGEVTKLIREQLAGEG